MVPDVKIYGTESKSQHKLRFAAIDIGTNAARLLLTNVYFENGHPIFKKVGLYRIPLQLGDDVFSIGAISNKKSEKLRHTMHAFSHLLQIFNPVASMACATSAMRESANGQELANQILLDTGIQIQIIDGKRESELICTNHLFRQFPAANYLYIDVGGGSTEIAHFDHHVLTMAESFKIGTLRLLNQWVEPDEWNKAKAFIRRAITDGSPTIAIGTGGNISKALSLTHSKSSKPVPLETIQKLHHKLESMPLRDRIINLNLKPDRAEVIVPALEIYVRCMKWAKINAIYIPKVGLSDGMIQYLFHNHVAHHPIPFETAGA